MRSSTAATRIPSSRVDEINKATGDAQYDPLGALYALLEHDTAQSFTDEFAEVPINAGNVVWIATANDARAIPEPLMNRMNVYEIPAPDRDGARRIAQAIYAEIRAAHTWGARFPETLGDALTQASPRGMRRAMLNAFGNAHIEERHQVEARDIVIDRNSRRKSMGF